MAYSDYNERYNTAMSVHRRDALKTLAAAPSGADFGAEPRRAAHLAGSPETKDVQETLMAAVQEKMITDYDFVPPALNEAAPRRR